MYERELRSPGGNRFAGLKRTGHETSNQPGEITARRMRQGLAPPRFAPLTASSRGGSIVPWIVARPAPRRLLRVAGIGALGIVLGVGATVAVDGLGGGGRAGRAASVQRLDLPAGAAPTPAPAEAMAPV